MGVNSAVNKIKLPVDKKYAVWMLLVQARNAVYKSREKELSEYDLTPEQAGALLAVNELGEKATISEIKLLLVREPHSVAILLNRMLKRGLLVKRKARNLKKSSVYALTQSGLDAFRNSIKRNSIKRAMSLLSKNELEQLELYMRKIRNGLLKQKINEESPQWP